jgi:hypothetical protein
MTSDYGAPKERRFECSLADIWRLYSCGATIPTVNCWEVGEMELNIIYNNLPNHMCSPSHAYDAHKQLRQVGETRLEILCLDMRSSRMLTNNANTELLTLLNQESLWALSSRHDHGSSVAFLLATAGNTIQRQPKSEDIAWTVHELFAGTRHRG